MFQTHQYKELFTLHWKTAAEVCEH